MNWLCYLYPADRDVPHLQVLSAETLDAAEVEARRAARERPDCRRIELWEDDRLVRALDPAGAG
jgi:hypothetical protein